MTILIQIFHFLSLFTAPSTPRDAIVPIVQVETKHLNSHKSALTLMKEDRLQQRKSGCPYSIWKLHEAPDEEHVIFEWTIPQGGSFSSMNCFTKIVVIENTAYIYSIEKNGLFTPEEKQAAINILHLS